ncbi:MAG: PTS sugar transporter subunit IIA [Phycisphaerales bacterium]|nr:PTS sugar transporter subunit IIA [Planctomycetota bacterium]MCZ6493275.1 PTS sugar transporter subunit IIA [Planctomycetota bacterium]MCZ6542392.1 PTS sugar transporter subunit IIA [Planctomycetota bacterium]MCZ6611583.1 PTS sugar transporter subunit IIA [Planctomycetota bacterium]MCZ6811115.1 PTS sugar transporter subunit IIA [Planctomycetota bacterium]
MKLFDIVVKKAIIPNLAATERDSAIAEAIDALVSAGALSPELRDDFIKAVVKRENRGSTGFGHGVAVPHVKHPAISKMAVAIAVSQSGVEFNALDRQPVYSIFLLLSPEDQPEEHLDAMEAIFGNLSQERFRRFLRQAKSVADIVTLMEEADAKAPVR